MADKSEFLFTGRTGTQSVADYEYNTLMRLLGVSVSKHLLDEHFTVIWANDFYYQLIGWTKEEYEATFHNHCDRYYEYMGVKSDWDTLTKVVLHAVETHQNGYNLVAPIRRKNGESVWVKFSTAFAEEYVNGHQVAYSVLTNIDDFVRMQQEQTVTYDNLPGFVAKYRIDGWFQMTLLDANDSFLDYFGKNGKNEEPSALYWRNIEDNMDVLTEHKEEFLAGKPTRFVMHVCDRRGSRLWLQVSASCVDWQNGCPVYLAIFIDITDVTELREMHKKLTEQTDALKNALAAAEHANHAKSEFLSRMSHDIRTPMNAIMGMTSIAASHIDNKERVLDCLGKIEVSSKLLLSLINEVLDMSKIESGRVTMAQEEFCLNDILQNIVTITQPSILEKYHSFDIHANQIEHEFVIGDPQRIEQVFLNILSNAIKYTPDHGKITLEIAELPSVKKEYGCYEFVFRDNGYGMKPDFLDKIFTPFERAKDAAIHAIQGTGLGMAISRNIVQMMDGEIQVESTYGEGSTFTVTIYLKLQPEYPTPFALLAPLPVLVVDDDQIACETTCDRLEQLGLSGVWVRSGKEAVEQAVAAHEKGKDFFAIIIDLKMPGMNGIETARKIREKVGDEVPIILLSAYDWTEYESVALSAGVNGFVSKPMLKSGLLYALKRYALKEAVSVPSCALNQPMRSYRGKRLLLAEDNMLNQEIALEILGRTGAAVETAANGQEAVERFALSPVGYYNLIFMDLQMPVMGGIEATEKIRRLNKKDAKTVPIVAMTANVFAEDVAEVKAAGMNGHLAKPLDIKMIEQVLEEYLAD